MSYQIHDESIGVSDSIDATSVGGLSTVYYANVDVSEPTGPGVNELQFIRSLHRVMQDRVRIVIPEISQPCELPPGCEFVPGLQNRRLFQALWSQFRALLVVRRVVGSFHPDVVVLRPGNLPVAAWLYSVFSNVPFVTKHAHLSKLGQHQQHKWLRRFGLTLRQMMLKSMIRRAVSIDVISDRQKADILGQVPLPSDRVVITDNCVDTSLFQPLDQAAARRELKLPETEFLVAYIGNLAASRGGGELVEALPKISGIGRSVSALIVEGDGKSKDQLLARAAQLGVADRVIVRGPVPLAEVPQYMAAMDVGVSLREDDGCAELKVRQYLAAGRPAIVSALTNQFVQTEDLGSLIARGDSGLLAEAIDAWIKRLEGQMNRSELERRIAEYAVRHLSFDAANRDRIETWRRAVAGSS